MRRAIPGVLLSTMACSGANAPAPNVQLTLSVRAETFAAREPVGVTVTMKNLGNDEVILRPVCGEPFEVRDSAGTVVFPYAHVTCGGQIGARYAPLAAGEVVTQRSVWPGYRDSPDRLNGVVVPVPAGRYTLRARAQPVFAGTELRSAPVTVRVAPDTVTS